MKSTGGCRVRKKEKALCPISEIANPAAPQGETSLRLSQRKTPPNAKHDGFIIRYKLTSAASIPVQELTTRNPVSAIFGSPQTNKEGFRVRGTWHPAARPFPLYARIYSAASVSFPKALPRGAA